MARTPLLVALLALGGGCLFGSHGPDPALRCDPIANTNDPGHHNPGSDCMQCHDGTMRDVPKSYMAGTVYSSLARGGAPLPGASIRVRDAQGQEVRVISALNGNFYMDTPVVYPITTIVSACPDTVPMLGTVLAPGACNSCHVDEGEPGRIRLP